MFSFPSPSGRRVVVVVDTAEHERVVLTRLLGVEGAEEDGPDGEETSTELVRLRRVADVGTGIVDEVCWEEKHRGTRGPL